MYHLLLKLSKLLMFQMYHISYLSQLVSSSCNTCRASRYSWHNYFDCNFQTRLVDQSPEDVNRETTAPLPIRALGTRRLCLELKNARLRRKAGFGVPEVPREATSPPHLTCPHSLTRNNSSLEENQVRKGVAVKGEGWSASSERSGGGWGRGGGFEELSCTWWQNKT